MSEFTAIDLSELPAPAVVEDLDFTVILDAMLADLQTRAPELEITETDPAYRVLEVAAYRELLLRQRVNEAARAVMLAYALDADLDNLAAFFGVQRLQVDPGDPEAVPPVPATWESDEDFRRRIQISPEAFSTAGPEGAYIYHALSADGTVLDARAHSPNPGEVVVTVLSRVGDGTPSQALLDTVAAAVSAEDVRPLTDAVTVQGATIVSYAITATLYFYAGPSSEPVLQLAQQQIEAYAEQQHRLGLDITLSGIYAALHQPGVQRVELASPAASIVVARESAAFCTGITLTDGGIDE